jgi:hypothetical protein
VDIDGDGYLDILSGSYSRTEPKMAGLLQVLYGNPDGTFRNAVTLKGTDGKPLIIPMNGNLVDEIICTRPFAVDWDGDGHLDLVVGNFSGTFYWFKGEGKGRFRPKPEMIKTGGMPLRIDGNHSDPFVIDWDGDGALDLISGTGNGGVQWARNRAGKGKQPDLAPFEWLIKPGRQYEHGQLVSEEQLTGPTRATRVWVADLNNDGKLDVIVGDWVTLLAPANGVTAEAFKREFPVWQSELSSASKALSAVGIDGVERARASQRFFKVYNRRTEFMKEDPTGFIWLYLQK